MEEIELTRPVKDCPSSEHIDILQVRLILISTQFPKVLELITKGPEPKYNNLSLSEIMPNGIVRFVKLKFLGPAALGIQLSIWLITVIPFLFSSHLQTSDGIVTRWILYACQ